MCIMSSGLLFNPFPTFLTLRLLVSASQDGKLIIWDSYTANKVSPAQQVNIHLKCIAITLEYNNCHKCNDLKNENEKE